MWDGWTQVQRIISHTHNQNLNLLALSFPRNHYDQPTAPCMGWSLVAWICDRSCLDDLLKLAGLVLPQGNGEGSGEKKG